MAKTRIARPPNVAALPQIRRRFGLKQLKEGLYDAPRPARKKGSRAAKNAPAADAVSTKAPLTLADIAIAWNECDKGPKPRTHYVTGATLARLVHTLRLRHPSVAGHDPLGGEEAMRVPLMLRGLS